RQKPVREHQDQHQVSGEDGEPRHRRHILLHEKDHDTDDDGDHEHREDNQDWDLGIVRIGHGFSYLSFFNRGRYVDTALPPRYTAGLPASAARTAGDMVGRDAAPGFFQTDARY